MRWFFVLCREVTRVFFHTVYDIRFEGVENIPKEKGYIIACNHLYYFDPILLTFRIKGWVHYLGKAELFSIPLIGWIFRAIGAVRVDRGTGDTTAIDTCTALARKGEIIGIFPEGTRSRDGTLGRPKSGMSLIAKQTGYDILPCAVLSERPLRFRGRVTIRYGQMIPAATLGLSEDSPRALKRATKLVWQEIATLAGVTEGSVHE